jgi:hypothetical protein
MESVAFADGGIMEFASGLKQNSSLCVLKVHGSSWRNSLALWSLARHSKNFRYR